MVDQDNVAIDHVQHSDVGHDAPAKSSSLTASNTKAARVPKEDMKSEDENAVYVFFTVYVHKIGFSVRKQYG